MMWDRQQRYYTGADASTGSRQWVRFACILILCSVLAPLRLIADESAKATIHIGITKLETARIDVAQTVVSIPSLTSENQQHVDFCLTKAEYSVPFTIRLDNAGARRLVDSNGTHSIPYQGYVANSRQTAYHAKCGKQAALLRLSVNGTHAQQVPAGFYSDNLIVIVTPE